LIDGELPAAPLTDQLDLPFPALDPARPTAEFLLVALPWVGMKGLTALTASLGVHTSIIGQIQSIVNG
jgi:hypothetical protein